MKPSELVEALKQKTPEGRAGLSDIAGRVSAESRQTIDEAVRIWAGGDPEMSRSAAQIIGLTGDTVIGPLLDISVALEPLKQVWRMKRIVKEQLQRQEEIVAMLEKLLNDKTEIPYPVESVPIEEPLAEERICDAAYILLRALLSPQSPPEDHGMDAHLFRDLEYEDRDKVIDQYLASGNLTDFEDMDAEE